VSTFLVGILPEPRCTVEMVTGGGSSRTNALLCPGTLWLVQPESFVRPPVIIGM